MDKTIHASMQLPKRGPAVAGLHILVDGIGVGVIDLQSERRPLVLGRDTDCDIQIDDNRISRHHCELQPAVRNQWVIIDHASSNGTLIGWFGDAGPFMRVSWEILTLGCQIHFGPVVLRPLDAAGHASIAARSPSEFLRAHGALSTPARTSGHKIVHWRRREPVK